MSSRIEDIDMNVSTLNASEKNKAKRTQDGSIIITNKNNDSSKKMSMLVSKDNSSEMEQLRELLGNESFGVLNFSTTVGNVLDGLYISEGGSTTQDGASPHRINTSLEGPFYKYKWNVDGEEITTDWDTIATEDFTEGGADNDINEGVEVVLDSGHKWRSEIGDWRVNSADDYLICDNDDGYNSCILIEKDGKDYPPVANIIIQAEIYPTQESAAVGLSLRNQLGGSATVYGYCYAVVFNPSLDLVYFYYLNGSTFTLIKTWLVNWDMVHNVALTMKIICQGDRFDIFLDDDNGDLQFIGTTFDEKYEVGYYGVASNGAYIVVDDLSLKNTKSIVAHLPVGAYDYNQIRMPTTSKLDDDSILGETSRTLIAPTNPIEFRQINLDGNNLNVPNGSEVVVWDTKDEALEADWQKVRDTDHARVGDYVVSNGKIRVFQDINNNYNYNNRMKIQGNSGNAWIDPVIDIKYYSGVDLTTYDTPVIKSIEKYKVILEAKASVGTVEILYEIHITQSNFAMIKVVDWYNVTSDITVIAATRSDTTLSQTYSISPRFGLISLDTAYDAEVDDGAVGNGTETEGLSLFFSTQNNIIGMFFSEDSSGNWRVLADSTEPIKEIYNNNAINFDLDLHNVWWGIGFVSFDTSILHHLGSTANWTGEDGSGIIWSELGLSVYSTGSLVSSTAISPFPAGAYRVFYLMAGWDSNEDGTLDCTGASANGSVDIVNVPVAGQWYYYDFIAAEDDSITFRFQRTDGTNTFFCGEIVIVPIANSKNFPLDEQNYALSIEHITETAG